MRIPSAGCWKSINGIVYRHALNANDAMAFELWGSGSWIGASDPGYGPWTPCEDPSKPEPRPFDAPLRRWLRETGRVACGKPKIVSHRTLVPRLRWNANEERIEAYLEDNRYRGWHTLYCSNSGEVYTPEDGKPW